MRVLIADDDDATRRLLASIITGWGFDVVVVKDGGEAWSSLQKDDGPQIAVLDWLMPNLEGVEVCRRLRAAHLNRMVYIILLTINDSDENMIEGLKAGADQYVKKPFNRGVLQAQLEVASRTLTDLERLLSHE